MKSIFKVGEEVYAFPTITGKTTIFHIISVDKTESGYVYCAEDKYTGHKYITRPVLGNDTKFFDAEAEHSCRTYIVKRKKN